MFSLKFLKRFTSYAVLIAMFSVWLVPINIAYAFTIESSDINTTDTVLDMVVDESGGATDGDVHVLLFQFSTNDLIYRHYDSSAQTWSNFSLDTDIQDGAGGDIALNLHYEPSVAWLEWDSTAGKGDVFFRQATSTDGSTWNPVVQLVDNEGDASGGVGLDYFKDGADEDYAYVATCASDSYKIASYTSNNDVIDALADFDSETQVSNNVDIGCSDVDVVISDVTGAEDHIHLIASPNSQNDEIYYLYNNGSWSTTEVLTGLNVYNDSHIEMDIDNSNNPRFIFWDNDTSNSNNNDDYLRYGFKDGSWSTDFLDQGKDFGGLTPSITTSSNNRDFVSYYDTANNTLKLAWTDNGGQNWEIYTLANGLDLYSDDNEGGASSAVQIAANGSDLALVASTMDSVPTLDTDFYEITNLGEWDQVEELNASDKAASDLLGESVAVDGDFIIGGAAGASTGGAAYIWETTDGGNTWTQNDKIEPSDGAAGDLFSSGFQGVDIDATNFYSIAGAYDDDDDGDSSGSAYIFKSTDSGGNWSQHKKLTASDAGGSDTFGHSVAIDGNHAIVGAEGYDVDAFDDAGAAYIFEKDEGGSDNWGEIKILAPNGSNGAGFGKSVAIDGDYAIVGAWNQGTGGAAYIYYKDEGGTDNWGLQDTLTASDEAAGDLFGMDVAMSGAYVVVSARGNDLNGTDSGSAYIFKRTGSGAGATWSEQQILSTELDEDYSYFGNSVAIDSNRVAIGAVRYDSYTGLAHVFERTGSTWSLVRTLYPNVELATSDYYGRGIGISEDLAAVGAYGYDAGGTSSAGAVFVFSAVEEGGGQQGGGEVPEFSTYMYMITLILGMAIVKKKYGKLIEA